MKLLKSIVYVLIIIAFGCGTATPGGSFTRDGVSFSYPAGWSITEQEELEGGGYYLSVEKEGFNSSGLVTLTWFNEELNPQEYLGIIQEEYESQTVLKNLEFQPARDNNINGIESISCDFKCSTLGVKHSGVIYVFVKGENTYAIIKLTAVEDISENKNGFDLFESTFAVNE